MKKLLLLFVLLIGACVSGSSDRGRVVERGGSFVTGVLEKQLGGGPDGATAYDLAPVSQATVTWFGEGETAVAQSDSDGNVPRLQGFTGVLISAKGYVPLVLYGWDETPRVAMLAERNVQAAPVRTTEEAALVVGRVEGYTPSEPGHQSEVRVYWRNQTGAVIDKHAAGDTNPLAVQALFDDNSNFIRLWLPAGDNELFFYERIYKDGSRTIFNLGRALYIPQYRVAAGMQLTAETFPLDRLPDQTFCYNDKSYRGSIRIRWPGLDRSFIRTATGGVRLLLSLVTPGGLIVPLASGTYDQRRIRAGNEMRYVYPLPLTGDLSAAHYQFASSASRTVDADISERIRFGRIETQKQPCDLAPEIPANSPPLEYPTGGATLVTGSQWLLRWNTMRADAPDLTPEIIIRRYDPALSLDQGAVLIRLWVNTSRLSTLALDEIPGITDWLPAGQYVLQVSTDDTASESNAWLQNPVKWTTDHAMMPSEFRDARASWIQYRRFTVR